MSGDQPDADPVTTTVQSSSAAALETDVFKSAPSGKAKHAYEIARVNPAMAQTS